MLERFLHILVVPRAGLGPGTLELLSESLAVLGRDLTLFGSQVRLVADNDEGNPFGALYEVVD